HRALGESNLSAVVGAHLHPIFDHIASHFSDPELSLSKVAQSLQISTRYLQRLLKTSGTSFTAHVTVSVMRKVYLRPMRSPIHPKRNAPSGRIRNPAVNSAIVLSKAATGWDFSKNLTDKTAAKLPKI